MERRRVPLPAPRDALSHVDPAGGGRPRCPACSDSRVDLLLRRGQPAHRHLCAQLLPGIQLRHLRGIPPEATPLPVAPQEDGGCPRQRPLPPRQTPPTSSVGAPPASRTALSSALQPQLAPIERVWKLTRRLATHNRYFGSLEELTTAVHRCFDQWREPNPVLRRLCGVT